MLGRGLRLVPRRPLSHPMLWRIVLDQAPLRLFVGMAPLPLAVALPASLALPLTPVLMVAAILAAERLFFSAGRGAAMGEAEAGRALDLLRVRARDALARIVAGRDTASEPLHLVVEQSPLARLPVLTLVSVQAPGASGGRLEPVELSERERAVLREHLFDDELGEACLHRVNCAQNRFVREIPFEAGSVTAHARLMAKAGRRAP